MPAHTSSLFLQRALTRFVLGVAGRFERMERNRVLDRGERWGTLAYRVAGRARRTAERNLRLAYADTLSPAQRDTLVRGVFRHFGMNAAEFLKMPAYTRDELLDLVAETVGYDPEQIERSRAHGMVIVIPHLGNFEFFARWTVARGYPLTVVARDPDDPVFRALVRRRREEGGYRVISKGGFMRPLLSDLKAGHIVGLLPDQNSGDAFVPFFGTPAGTTVGPAFLALNAGAPVLPAACVRLPDRRFRIVCLPPIETEPTGDKDADRVRIMTRVNAAFETMIRDYPDQYLWLHNRWKSAFEEKNRGRWPEGIDYAAKEALWRGAL